MQKLASRGSAFAVVCAFALFGVDVCDAATMAVTRVLKNASGEPLAAYEAGQQVTVELNIVAEGTYTLYAIKDFFPENWVFIEADNGGTNVQNKVSWQATSAPPETLSYKVEAVSSGAVNFTGEAGGRGDGATVVGTLTDSPLPEALDPAITGALTSPAGDDLATPLAGLQSISNGSQPDDPVQATFTAVGAPVSAQITDFEIRVIEAKWENNLWVPVAQDGDSATSPTWQGQEDWLNLGMQEGEQQAVLTGGTFTRTLAGDATGIQVSATWAVPAGYVAVETPYLLQMRAAEETGGQAVRQKVVEFAFKVVPNLPPVFSDVSPAQATLQVDEGASQEFAATATDPENEGTVALQWRLNGENIAGETGISYTYSPGYVVVQHPGTSAEKTLSLLATDQKGGVGTQSWTVTVADMNQVPVFSAEADITFEPAAPTVSDAVTATLAGVATDADAEDEIRYQFTWTIDSEVVRNEIVTGTRSISDTLPAGQPKGTTAEVTITALDYAEGQAVGGAVEGPTKAVDVANSSPIATGADSIFVPSAASLDLMQESQWEIDLTTFVDDPDGIGDLAGGYTIAVDIPAGQGQLTAPTADGKISFAPDATPQGDNLNPGEYNTEFTFQAMDADGASVQVSITLQVRDNQLPSIASPQSSSDGPETANGQPAVFEYSITASDPDSLIQGITQGTTIAGVTWEYRFNAQDDWIPATQDMVETAGLDTADITSTFQYTSAGYGEVIHDDPDQDGDPQQKPINVRVTVADDVGGQTIYAFGEVTIQDVNQLPAWAASSALTPLTEDIQGDDANKRYTATIEGTGELATDGDQEDANGLRYYFVWTNLADKDQQEYDPEAVEDVLSGRARGRDLFDASGAATASQKEKDKTEVWKVEAFVVDQVDGVSVSPLSTVFGTPPWFPMLTWAATGDGTGQNAAWYELVVKDDQDAQVIAGSFQVDRSKAQVAVQPEFYIAKGNNGLLPGDYSYEWRPFNAIELAFSSGGSGTHTVDDYSVPGKPVLAVGQPARGDQFSSRNLEFTFTPQNAGGYILWVEANTGTPGNPVWELYREAATRLIRRDTNSDGQVDDQDPFPFNQEVTRTLYFEDVGQFRAAVRGTNPLLPADADVDPTTAGYLDESGTAQAGSPFSDWQEFTIGDTAPVDSLPPGVPVLLPVTGGAVTSVKLEWTGVTETYKLYVADPRPNGVRGILNVTGTSYILGQGNNPLTPGLYRWSVLAVRGDGTMSAWAAEQSFVIEPAVDEVESAESLPSALVAIDHDVADDATDVTFVAAFGIIAGTSVEVQIADRDAYRARIFSAAGNTVVMNAADFLEPGKFYHYRARGVNENGAGPWTRYDSQHRYRVSGTSVAKELAVGNVVATVDSVTIQVVDGNAPALNVPVVVEIYHSQAFKLTAREATTDAQGKVTFGGQPDAAGLLDAGITYFCRVRDMTHADSPGPWSDWSSYVPIQ